MDILTLTRLLGNELYFFFRNITTGYNEMPSGFSSVIRRFIYRLWRFLTLCLLTSSVFWHWSVQQEDIWNKAVLLVFTAKILGWWHRAEVFLTPSWTALSGWVLPDLLPQSNNMHLGERLASLIHTRWGKRRGSGTIFWLHYYPKH